VTSFLSLLLQGNEKNGAKQGLACGNKKELFAQGSQWLARLVSSIEEILGMLPGQGEGDETFRPHHVLVFERRQRCRWFMSDSHGWDSR
jgi:hypothetical protein